MSAEAPARVLYWNNIPSPYMVERFNAIAKSTDLQFEACFNEKTKQWRSWDVKPEEWRFDATYLGANRARRLFSLFKLLRRRRPDVLVTIYGDPVFAAGIILAKMMRVKVVLRTLASFDTWVDRGRFRELSKRFLFSIVDGFQAPGPDASSYVQSRGANPKRVHCFAEPVDVRHFAEGAAMGACERAELRAALGLSGCIFLYVGRLWKKKGLDYLIEAYRQLRKKGYDASLLLAGDGVDEAFYREMVGDLPNVVFLGFVQKPELPRWYGVADVMVFPTLGDPYGHVVQEAMAASRAVISSENAGDVRGRVLEGVTGFIVPAADSNALYEKMRTLTQDPELRCSMGKRGFDHIASRTPQWWAGNFARMISQIQRGQPAAEHMYM